MPANKQFKIKMFAIYAVISTHRRKEDAITAQQIAEILESQNIACTVSAVHREVDEINEYFFKYYPLDDTNARNDKGETKKVIIRYSSSHNEFYYYFNEYSPYAKGAGAKEKLSSGELRFLYDAVYAANFIPYDMAEELADKIARLAPCGEKKYFVKYADDDRKNRHLINKGIFITADAVCRAIDQKSFVTFTYHIFDCNNELKPRRAGKDGEGVKKVDIKIYNIYPVALVVNAGYYYMCGIPDKWNNADDMVRVYRLDRIKGIAIKEKEKNIFGEEYQIKLTGDQINVINAYKTTDEQYQLTGGRMWHGKKKTVTIEFIEYLIGDIIDKFGINVKIRYVRTQQRGEGKFVKWFAVSYSIYITTDFFAWVFQFGKDMKITGDIENDFKKHLMEVADMYMQGGKLTVKR